jgi:hypothetical protein
MGLPPGSWEPVPAPRVIGTRKEARRQFRYIALNEPRRGLAGDPLESLWSTYREMFGAVDDPWTDVCEVLQILGNRGRGALDALHAYTSGDPSVHPAGTPSPRPAPCSDLSTVPLGDVFRAAAAATRGDPRDVQQRGRTRKIFIWTAKAVGWWRPTLLAQVCNTTAATIRRIAATPEAAATRAGLACLGDARLLARTPLARDLRLLEFRAGSDRKDPRRGRLFDFRALFERKR